MKNKKTLAIVSLGVTTLAVGIAVGIATGKELGFKAFANPTNAEWHHYSKTAPTASQKGVREYWVQCGGSYQFTAPDSENIVDKGTNYDLSEFTADDPRYLSYQYDVNHAPLFEYDYGAAMYCTNVSDFKNWRITYLDNEYDCNLYNEGSDFYLWRIDLPRIDYTRYPTVTMNLAAPNWYENNMMGPEADQLTYHTVYGGNKGNGKIKLSLTGAGVFMEVIDMEYGTATAFTNLFTNSDIIHGLAPAYFYTQDKYDRYLNISNITLSTESQPIDVCSYAGDTSKLDVVNGDVALPGSVDYSIISNGYGTNDNSLLVQGNANPGAAVFSLPVFNFDQYTSIGNVSFKFGVKNNNEHMYFGSGASRVDLGTNSPNSQSENNNGYVNWELIVTADVAYIHNVQSNTNYLVQLTAGMRNGTENIVLSGGDTSVYRVYLFCDYYWQLDVDYEFVAPTTPIDVCSYAGDTSKLDTVNGDVALPGSVDYSIINNNYGTNNTSLVVSGNANPGAAVVALPAFNFDLYAFSGNVSFKFGVKNNGEHMYFGSGASRVDLGTNAPDSQSNNNNGYVNWELIVTADVAYIHNVQSNTNYLVQLTAGMRNGTENIVLSGGDTSVYRVYLFCDYYWQLNADYALTAPTTPLDVCSFAGDTTKLGVVNGTAKLPGSVDYSIINNGYGTNDNSLLVQGNANPGAAVLTLQAFNIKQYTVVGKVSFKFGVSNNNEHMYFGSGASRVDLGTNAPDSQSNNNNGYVNWEMVITADGAYVHNTYEDQNYNVTLTAEMRSGAEGIVISGGDTSIYRNYFVTDFYWHA